MSIWKSLPSWRYQMETFSVSLAICAGNSPASGEFPAQRPVTQGFDVFLDLCLNKQLRKQSRGCSFERLSCPLWCHCNALDMLLQLLQLICCCWIDRIRAVGYQTNFMGSTIFPNFYNYWYTGCKLNTTFIWQVSLQLGCSDSWHMNVI